MIERDPNDWINWFPMRRVKISSLEFDIFYSMITDDDWFIVADVKDAPE
jgi:hypothetical protein